MNLDSQIKLGQSTSLLTGYKANIYSVPIINSTKPALYEKDVSVQTPDYDAKWSWPTISFHDNAEDLLSGVLKIKLRPNTNEDVASEGGASSIWPAGALVLAGLDDSARKKALTELSDQLGIDLSNSDWSYALVSRSRKIGTATHPCYERGLFGNPDPDNTLKSDFLAALKSLEKPGKESTNVSMHGANGYLQLYETYGSHFVSSIDAGDLIFQVFAFASTEYQSVVQTYAENPEHLSGPLSVSFALFTTPRNEAGYGRTAAIGNICIASGDPKMTTTLQEDLWNEPKYAGTNSIFAPFYRSDAVNVNTIFKKIVVITVELASLGVFAEYYRMLIWRRVFKGAMYSKFSSGSGVAPYFSNNCPYDLDAVFMGSDPLGGDGLLSTLATPTINIWQEKVNLSLILLQFPELVKDFGVFSNAIQVPAPTKDEAVIDVPGSATVTLLGHVITCGGIGPIPPTLRLSDSAFKEIKTRMFCGGFYGGLHISSSSNSRGIVIMNGLMFEESGGQVSVVRDVRDSPSMKVLTERLTDIQFALVAAEARLNYLLANPSSQAQSIELMKRFLLWLAGVAGSQYQNDQLAALQARAMYLASVVAKDQGAGVPVPYLRYDAYKDVVNNVQNVLRTASETLTNFQNQIRARKAEERQIDREKALNENIINSGKLLQDYIGTQADYQQSLADMYSSVVKDKESELEKASKQAAKLSASLTEQRGVVDKAVIEYQDAVADWQQKEMIKAVINIASNLFALGFTFAAPSSAISAVESLGETVQKIQKAVQVFDAVIKAYRSFKALPSNPQKVFDALKDIGLKGLEMPSSLEWDEMKVNFDATLSTGPDLAAKTSLSAAFAVLVLRGKALLQSQNTIQGIAADLSAAQQRITLHKEQEKRLDDLKVDLNAKPEELDVAKIDLVGLSGQLVFFERQMLMTLASTLVIQDRALQYEYLRPPTAIGSFTMHNLQLAILTQSQSINQGLTVQPLPAKLGEPIIYEIHGVKPATMINNQRFTFNISLNKREFSSYNYVRVEGVAVEIDGIVSTKSGKYYTELVFDGNPFFDRGFDGEALEFQTTSRIFTSLNDISSSGGSNATTGVEARLVTTGENPFGGKISSITPFSSWQVSLPKTQSNEDIKFEDNVNGVTVRLIFNIYAQLKEKSVSSLGISRLHLNRGDYVGLNASASNIQANSVEPPNIEQSLENPAALMSLVALPVPLSLSAAPATTSVTLFDVLKMMSGKSVCAGWDVVFSMTAKEVNDQLYDQYTNRLDNPKFLRETGEVVKETKTSEGVITKTVFNFVFNAPRLQFLLNNSNSAQIFLPIKSGHYEYSIFANGYWIPVSKGDIKETDKSYIQGDVPLAIMPGSVSTQHNVSIKLNGGAFSAKDFEAGVSNPMLGSVLTDYFTNLKDGYEVYNLGTLDFAGISVLQSLIPTDFKLNVYHTPSNRDLLQLFIATTGKLQSSTALYLQEPIPSNNQSSLIINSKIFFQHVLPASLGDGGIGLVLESVAPTDDLNKDKTWSSKARAGSVSSPFPEERISAASEKLSQYQTLYTESYIKVDNNKAVVDLTGMKFTHDDQKIGFDIKMIYNVPSKAYPFLYGSRRKISGNVVNIDWSQIYYQTYSLGVDIRMSTTLPLGVKGSGQNQLVQIAATQSSVYISGKLEPPAGACECNDRDLQKKFLDNLQKTVPATLVDVFNKPFDAVSLFALKNLLFPAKNLITMIEAHVPGDLVIFGNFTRT